MEKIKPSIIHGFDKAKKPLVEAYGISSLCNLLDNLDMKLIYLCLLGLHGENGLLLLYDCSLLLLYSCILLLLYTCSLSLLYSYSLFDIS